MGVILDESDFIDSGPRILSEDDFMPEQGSRLGHFAGVAGQAITDIPGQFGELGRNLSQNVRHPLAAIQRTAKNPRESIKQVGGMSAGLAGALGGAAVGSALGPVGTVLGGGLGYALANLGYKGANQALGNEKETLTPSGAADELVYDATQGVVLGGLGEAAGAATRALPRALMRASDSYALDALGAKGSDVAKGFRKGITYLDESGKTAPLTEATEAVGSLQRSLEVIKKDGFKVANDAEANLIKANARVSELSTTAESLIAEADAAIAQTAQTTGARLRPRPDFTEAQAYIDKLKLTDEPLAGRLQARMDSIKQSWQQTGRTLSDLRKFKQSLAESEAAWSGTQAAAESIPNKFMRKLYRAFQQPLETTFDAIMSKVDPKKVGALKETNSTIAAYMDFREPLIKAQGKNAFARAGSGSLGSHLARGTVAGIGGAYGSPAIPAAVMVDYLARAKPGTASRAIGRMADAAGAVRPVGRAAQQGSRLIPALLGATEAIYPANPKLTEAQLVESLAQGAPPEMPAVVSAKFIQQLARPAVEPVLPEPTGKGVEPRLPEILATSAGVEPMLPDVPADIPMREQIISAIEATERSGSADTSPKGAKGKFQLMDATGRAYHRRLKIKEAYDPSDDKQAKKIAGAFIDDLIKKYRDPLLVAAGYNMGEKNLDRFIAQYGPNWEDIEPHLKGAFLETKKYVPFFQGKLTEV